MRVLTETLGLGAIRPVLFCYKKVVTSASPSPWARDVPIETKTGPSAYFEPNLDSEPESIHWDELHATKQEHAFIEFWLSFVLRLVPDEIHATQRMVEASMPHGLRVALVILMLEWPSLACLLAWSRHGVTLH